MLTISVQVRFGQLVFRICPFTLVSIIRFSFFTDLTVVRSFAEDVDHIYTGSRKAARISDFANEDSEDLSRRSHLKDRKLLDDITTKLVGGRKGGEGGGAGRDEKEGE